MVHAGARGSTAEEIGRVFHFDARQDSLHPAFGALQRSLDRGVSLGGYRISIANRLWGQRGEAFQPEFLDLTRKHYDAEMEIVDFRSNPDAVRVHINDWVANQTEGRIEDLFPEGSISDRSRLVLANAIYFKGSWQYRFNPDDTRDGNFALPQNRRDTVPMMRMLATLPFAQPPGLSVLALPYAGKDLEMVLLLPNEADGLGSLERSFSSDAVVAWTQGTREVEVQVAVPRFSFTSAITLGEVLGRMGMPTAFSDAADFTGIRASGGLKISEAFHQAFILVNEEGTEAAAATGVDMGETSLPVFPEFIADHPFLFLIRDRVTGSILFLGRVENPRG
jgi:serpin B